jgi:uncharacterized protein YutE (UPF0331/DUF86 family)
MGVKMGVDIEYLKSRIKEIQDLIKEINRLTSKNFNKMSMDEKYSLRYQIIVLVEALGSLCLHIVIEDLGKEPESAQECFKFLEEAHLISNSDNLIKIARLRNLITHKYWTIDDAKIYNAIKDNFKEVNELLMKIGERYEILP